MTTKTQPDGERPFASADMFPFWERRCASGNPQQSPSLRPHLHSGLSTIMTWTRISSSQVRPIYLDYIFAR